MIVDKLLQEELKTQAREINGSERLYLELYQVIGILRDYETQQQVSVEPEVIKKTAGKNNYEDMWNEYKTWTENIGEWIHKENFIKAMNRARKDGIRFTKTLMNKYGIAKTFNDRIEKELKK